MKYLVSILILFASTSSLSKNYSVEERIAQVKAGVESRIPKVLKKISSPDTKLTFVTYKSDETVEIWMTVQPHNIWDTLGV